MADPYAERAEQGGEPLESPAEDAALARLAEARGGRVARSWAELAAWGSGSGLGAVLVRDEGLLPPLARLAPEHAVILLASGRPGPGELRAALGAARSSAGPILLLKEGLVAGPSGSEGAFEIELSLSEALLEAAASDAVDWEQDPDFGYEVAAGVEGVGGVADRALCPRLLYADHDRVYEHAELVVSYKRRRWERLQAAEAADPALLAASGWPIEPTGQAWKD